jgi:phytoene desaturase
MENINTDVVVIGSGMGGMCAAALLAHAGYKVMVLETLDFVGGRYSCIEYKGHKIATGGHMVNHGKDDPICITLDEVEAPEVEFKEFKIPVRYRIGGKDILLEAKGGLKNLVRAAADNDLECEVVMQNLYKSIRWQEPTDALSLREWLLQFTPNQRIHNIFQAQATAFTGVNYQEFPSGEFFRFLQAYGRLRTALVSKNTGRTIIEALRFVIEKKGGKVMTATLVNRILVDKGKAHGVVAVKDGKTLHIEAKAVVSNAGPKMTLNLAGNEHFDGWYVKQVREGVKPSVAMDYIFESKRPLSDGVLFTIECERTECWTATSQIWPEEAAGGMHTMEAVAIPPSGTNYDTKEEYRIFLKDLYEQIPHFEECGGRLILARRFCGEWPYNRCYQGLDLPQKTPVEYLYNVGDGVKPKGWVGASGAAMSGRLAAGDIRERIKKS